MTPPAGKSELRLTSHPPPARGPQRNKNTRAQRYRRSLAAQTGSVRHPAGLTLNALRQVFLTGPDTLQETNGTIIAFGACVVNRRERCKHFGSRPDIETSSARRASIRLHSQRDS